MFFADYWYGFRDRLVSNRRFQRWAASSPFTRYIARRRSSELFDLCAGFVYSQVVVACVELKLLEKMRRGPVCAAQLAAQGPLDESAMQRLLQAACALRLVRVARVGQEGDMDKAYGLGDLGASLLGNPGVTALIEHHKHFYADLANPVDLLTRQHSTDQTALGKFWPYVRSDDPGQLNADAVQHYTKVMSASQQMIADQVLAAYPLKNHQRLLDVGGGSGEFVKAVARVSPAVALGVFDLPAVTQFAVENTQAASLTQTVDVTGGDFFTDPLPGGADLISLIRIVHDHDDAQVAVLLKAVIDALPPGGTLLLAEPMAGNKQEQRVSDAYFTMYLHAMGSGKPRTKVQLSRLLESVGFVDVREHATAMPALVRVLTCQRPD